MKIMKNAIFLIVITIILSCNSQESVVVKISNDNLNQIQDYWIMTDYIDTILTNKSISKSRNKRLTSGAIMLHIENDSITNYGLILGSQKINLNHDYENLATLWGMNEYNLKYDLKGDILKSYALNSSSDSILYIFRRIKPKELRLIESINDINENNKFKNNFNSLFRDRLICGTYTNLSKSKSILKLNSDGTSTGMNKFNKYNIHDYFGTLHQYSNEDVIIFEDTLNKSLNSKKNPKVSIYSWRFNSDTLILTEMLTENYDLYYKGNYELKYIKN